MKGAEWAGRVRGWIEKSPVGKSLSPSTRETLYLRTFGLTKIPFLFLASPRIVELTDQKVTVAIPLNRRTRNHLNSLYFGTLAIGADCAGGLIAAKLIDESGERVSLIFKDFHADFLKRAEGETHFTCADGPVIADLVRQAVASGERVQAPVHVVATVPSKLGSEPVAKFTLTLSLKKK
jgi:acyl-coenzyme A thioesterase PaaI-like protein